MVINNSSQKFDDIENKPLKERTKEKIKRERSILNSNIEAVDF